MTVAPVKIWDLPLRLWHWLLVILIAVSWWSGEVGGLTLQYHLWSGYAVLTLLLFRLAWGVAGGEHARFVNFVVGPRRVLASLGALLNAQPQTNTGHNPLGGWMVVALLLALAVQTGTGLFANDDLINEGPLYAHVSKTMSDRLSGMHTLNFSILLGLVALHVLAIGYHRWRKGEHLTSAMISGAKLLPADTLAPAPASLWLAVVLVTASGGIVALIVNL